MTNKLKNKRGFSLVELMVVVAIMGTLASIAIPAFNEYRKTAKRASYRADLTSLHKSWLAFGVELDSFCERESGSSPTERVASIVNVGMASLSGSKYYGPNANKNNFIGFGGSGGCATWNAAIHIQSVNTPPLSTALVVNNAAAQIDTDCTLDIDEYEMGVFGHVSGADYYGLVIEETGVVTDATTHASPVEVAGDAGKVCI